MDLRPFNLTKRQILEAKLLLGYQPFIISDNIQTGRGYAHIYGENLPQVMDKDRASVEEWNKFVEANARMRKMYDDWIETACAIVGDLSKLSVADVGCSTGYLLYRFWEKGARNCIGYDRSDYSHAINLLNDITGYKVKFVHEPYNPLSHKIEGCTEHDIVISSAVMCHLSDPLNHISFLAQITKRALLLHTQVSEEDAYIVHYGTSTRKFSKGDPFPVCFDDGVTISRRFLLESLHLAGFRNIQEIKYSDEWLPRDWYRWWTTVVALKGVSVQNPMRSWNVKNRQFNRRSRMRHFLRNIVGPKLYTTFSQYVKSRPKLRSLAEKFLR